MSDQPTAPLHVQRHGPQDYTGHNDRGAHVRIGGLDDPDAFAPGELLAIALGACGLLSADHTLAGRLGNDFDARVDITATKTDAGDRYHHVTADILTDLTGLDEQDRAALITRALAAIERHCTISHTLDHGASSTTSISSSG